MDRNRMIHHLSMFWDGNLDLEIPSAGTAKQALSIFKTNLAAITWHYMTTLENNPTTLPQTETILKGQSVSGIKIDDMMPVHHYGKGAKRLASMIADGTFSLDEKTACALHDFVGRDEALTWGIFRDSLVRIQSVEHYTPPYSELLSDIAKKGFSFLETEIVSPCARAVATFLFMSRTQFFHDANKRTASLMMNGILMSAGYYPITIMNRDSEEFHTKLQTFYNSGNATEMMHFFEKSVKSLYHARVQKTVEPDP
jgi:Fic family protein